MFKAFQPYCFGVLSVVIPLAFASAAAAQPVPSPSENIPFLVTFGKDAPKDYGDDDHIQIFFFVVPEETAEAIYFRIFDPDTGGMHNEQFGEFNTRVSFSVHGGNQAYSHPDARSTNPSGNFRSGNELQSVTFGIDPNFDNKWFTMGPFNPKEGERVPELKGYVFKLIAQGLQGDDGNLYHYFMSLDPNANTPVPGGNAFTYEYTFRLNDTPGSIVHLYPFIDNRVVAVQQFNFDLDSDGRAQIVSVAKNGIAIAQSGSNEWASSRHEIVEEEHNTSMNIQFIKGPGNRNNNLAFHITNQYGEALPFFSIPLGGAPKYRYNVRIQRKRE